MLEMVKKVRRLFRSEFFKANWIYFHMGFTVFFGCQVESQ